jgi:hypothetical protein
LNGTAVAYGDAFGLHAGVSVGAGGDISADIGGSAGSELIDFWTFTGAFPTVAIASLEITSHGIETANVGTGAASTQLNVSDGIASAECHFDNSGNCTANILFDPALGLSVVLNLAVKAECLLVGSGACSSDSDFLNTTFISALSFTDADGDPLDLTFTSESGLTFPMPQPTVNEPATVALLGIGIVGVVVTRRVAYRRVREQIVWHRKPQP